ncbi:hypothetical protein CRG98_039226 [Punica granatum]|uniref:Uncharacterized protein n=1 Tax=Punica granatum TaxID=22663 RepID=A0A2I0I9M6_PUNGR|nr:hypothetical protein CRG98_039226 [Punica granatum]
MAEFRSLVIRFLLIVNCLLIFHCLGASGKGQKTERRGRWKSLVTSTFLGSPWPNSFNDSMVPFAKTMIL